MSTHFRQECEGHGIVVTQCRCPGPKASQTVPCPDTEWHAQKVAEIEAAQMDGAFGWSAEEAGWA